MTIKLIGLIIINLEEVEEGSITTGKKENNKNIKMKKKLNNNNKILIL